MPPADHCALAFGLRWRADLSLDAFDTEPCLGDAGAYDVTVRRVARLADRASLRPVNRGQLYIDGVRCSTGGEATFDLFDGNRIEYLPGPAWRGTLPAFFYSTVAAITLAWRGDVPFHACAVEMGGRAILIAGPSGAGKSSLTAALLGLGTRFVADDLTAVRVTDDGLTVLRGRPAMRQHEATAARIDAEPPVKIAGDARGKWLVRPHARAAEAALPLGGVLALSGDGTLAGALGKLEFLAAHLFRPRWLSALPNHVARRRQLLELATRIPVIGFPSIVAFDPADQTRRAHHALEHIAAMIGAESAEMEPNQVRSA